MRRVLITALFAALYIAWRRWPSTFRWMTPRMDCALIMSRHCHERVACRGGYSWGHAMNNSGQVAGYSDTASGHRHAFSWSPTGTTTGGMTDLGSLGGGYSQGRLINDVGQVAGYSYTSRFELRPFVWTPATGLMTDLGTLGGDYSVAYGVNNSGHVVGHAATAPYNNSSAFAWTAADGMVDLNTRIPPELGLHLYSALAISDNGSIVAYSNAGLVLLVPGVTSSAAPALGPIAANDPVAVGSPVTVSASFTDADSADTHMATWTWGDAGTPQAGTVTETSGAGSAAGSHTYSAAGVYQVTLK
jgi:probable HAF family extracellular repeat protein